MSTVSENALRILNAVYEETLGNQGKLIDTRKYMQNLNLKEDEVRSAADYLMSKRLLRGVQYYIELPSVFITADGIDEIELAQRFPSQATTHLPAIQNIITVGTMHGGAIQQGTVSSTQSVNITYTTNDLARLAIELSKLRTALVADASDAEHYAAVGAIAGAEIAAKEGRSDGVSQSLRSITKKMAGWVSQVGSRVGAHFVVEAITKLMA